jgi:hypothetical protein
VPLSPEAAKLRARIAGITSKRGPDDPEIPLIKSELESVVLAEHIQRVLAQAPPLTIEQRGRLAELLKPVRRAPKTATIAETHASVIAKRTARRAESPPRKMPHAPYTPSSRRKR